MNGHPVDNPDRITMYSLELPSQIESLTQVENLVDVINEQYALPDDIYANMLTCLSEATNNAVFHGNREASDKSFSVNFKALNDNLLTFKIIDKGPGFDYNNLPDPTDPANLEKLTGRGIFIIRQLADKCVFNEKGNEVEIHFNI